MKKIIAHIVICFSMIYTVAALEVIVPAFNFGILAGKPDSSTEFTVVQESSINFRLLHGERFYSDLNLALYIPDILHFFDPDQLARTQGKFTLIDFSLNFPNLAGKPLILSIFTGQHQSIIGSRYSFDFLKHGIRPTRMYEHDVAALFTPPHPREGLGVSFAGLILNVGYAGGSFSWNTAYTRKGEFFHLLPLPMQISLSILQIKRQKCRSQQLRQCFLPLTIRSTFLPSLGCIKRILEAQHLSKILLAISLRSLNRVSLLTMRTSILHFLFLKSATLNPAAFSPQRRW